MMQVVTNQSVEELTLTAGKDALVQEANCLLNLSSLIGDDFINAVEIMDNCKGRVIVTGMGKSGHIGNKIAATLASTGSPSFAVHPGEASHGDLGMITTEDVVLAFSHSGETRELGDVLAHCARFNIPLISITGKTESTLGRASNVCLVNGVTEEACPINCAPTSSTTATLALGDALAIALMKRRGFNPEDFATFHPGGKLGSKLATVDMLMASGDELPLVTMQTPMSEALLVMTEKRLGLVGVTSEDGLLAGIITDGDLRRHLSSELLVQPAGDVMSANPKTISASELAVRAVSLMQDKKITALFALDASNKPVGVIHIHSCLQAGVI